MASKYSSSQSDVDDLGFRVEPTEAEAEVYLDYLADESKPREFKKIIKFLDHQPRLQSSRDRWSAISPWISGALPFGAVLKRRVAFRVDSLRPEGYRIWARRHRATPNSGRPLRSAGKHFNMSSAQLVRDGSKSAKAELKRRGRGPDGRKGGTKPKPQRKPRPTSKPKAKKTSKSQRPGSFKGMWRVLVIIDDGSGKYDTKWATLKDPTWREVHTVVEKRAPGSVIESTEILKAKKTLRVKVQA